ncbi:glycosyltransferase [Helicobacter canis]|uniref:Glycosyltransferase family 4 protein n=1 Tax=Helicobacter canis TaxID=29419 RepID=A0A5M9QGX9_9HELI|nr:glycosyltransferase [Helicobacter canis]KAA8707638.1 glycosyltransferase family 4 protein [Helicobacter canis]
MPPKIPRKCLKPPKFQLPRFQLLGASDCENPSAISKEQILAWQEQGIIEYLGSTKDVRPFLESATCVVLPSSYKEGVPRVLLEAMSMGKAIITTNIAGCRECVAPPLMPYENLLIGQNGILIPPKDAQALSLAISLLLSNELPHTHNALMQMGTKARELVKGRFDVARIVECYKKAVGEKQTELDSSVQVDCHADTSALARNDKKPQNLKSAQDSRLSHNNTDSKNETRRQDFEVRIVALQGESRAHTRVYVTADSPQQSAILAQKPTPKPSKAESHANLVFVSNTCFAMHNFRLQVLKSLQKSGFTIHIIAPFDSSTQALQQEGFITHNLYLDSRSLNPLKDFRTITMLHKLLKLIRPALVFNYTIKPAIYSSSVCNFLKIPNIALITGLGYVFINDKGKTSSLKKRVLRSIVCKMYRFALSKTQEVWFLNNDDKQEFLSYKLIKQNQAFLLDSEGVDTEYFSPKSSDVKAEKQGEQEQVEQKEIVFLLVARMLWDKGVGEFVEAAKMVQDSIKEANRVESNGGGGHNKTFT